MKLSNNFYLEEFTRSRIATINNINNIPNQEQINNIKLLVDNILQPLRFKIDCPITITSGFRNKIVNSLVAGVYNSKHTEGKAADIIVNAISLTELFVLIYNLFDYHKLIFEFGEWIHISYEANNNHNLTYIAKKINGETKYFKFNGDFSQLNNGNNNA